MRQRVGTIIINSVQTQRVAAECEDNADFVCLIGLQTLVDNCFLLHWNVSLFFSYVRYKNVTQKILRSERVLNSIHNRNIYI